MTELTQEYSLAGVALDSPFINAAGTINGINPDRILSEAAIFAETAIGAIKFGSITIPSQEGNEVKYGQPVYYHDPLTGLTYNSMGLPNIGLEAFIDLVPRIFERTHYKKTIIVSGSPTNSPEYGSSVDQAVKLAYGLLNTSAHLVELNVSCPNVVTEGGGRKPIMGYDLETMTELIDALYREVGEGERLGIKLPPYLTAEQYDMIPAITKLFKERDIFSFLVTANTIPGKVPVNEKGENILTVPGGMGGMSGPATKNVGREQLAIWHDHIGENIDVVSTLGVDNGEEVAIRLMIGAVAAEAATLFMESSNPKTTITRVLSEYAEIIS